MLKFLRNSVKSSCLAFCLLLVGACAHPLAPQFVPFERCKPTELQPNPEGLESLKYLLEETKTKAALVLFEGRIIAEWYWHDAGADTAFDVWSVTKSFASTGIGALIDDGRIGSLDNRVADYVPSWRGGSKSRVTLRHILLQSSGLRETPGFFREANQLEAALDADIITTPGAITRYNNVGCNVLAAVIAAAANEDPEAYMMRRIWKPIGMESIRWRRDSAGNVMTYAGLQMSAKDLARFGQLFLNGGTWGKKHILNRRWISEATSRQTTMNVGGFQVGPYGYLWWLDQAQEKVPPNYSALGLFGNNLTVIPQRGLVAVRLVGTDNAGMPLMFLLPQWVEAVSNTVK